MESASNATTPLWCCGHGAQCRLPVKKLGLEIQWIDLLSCCLPRGLLVLLVFRKLAQGVSLYSIAHIVRLNMSELSFRWVGLTRRLVRYSFSSSCQLRTT